MTIMTTMAIQSPADVKRLNKALDASHKRLMASKKKVVLQYLRSIDPDLDKRIAKDKGSKPSK